jgi:hypothetical protein
MGLGIDVNNAAESVRVFLRGSEAGQAGGRVRQRSLRHPGDRSLCCDTDEAAVLVRIV